MNWYKISQKINITFQEELESSHDNQLDIALHAIDSKGDIVGSIFYAIYDDNISINNIVVEEDFRRLGIGTALMKNLQSRYPNNEINTGYRSERGDKLYQSLPKRIIPNKEYNILINKKDSLELEFNELQKQLNDFYNNPNLAQDAHKKEKYMQIGNRWNDVSSQLDEINERLREIKKETILIEN